MATESPTATAASAIPVGRNPTSPEDDLEQTYEWRAVSITIEARIMADEMRHMTEVECFEYASTKALVLSLIHI